MRADMHSAIAATVRIALLGAMLTPGATAQQEVVPVQVTTTSDRSVYLNHGRDIGLQVGDRVALFPPGAGQIEVVVRSLSHTSARAEVAPGVALPPVGTSGEATVTPEAPTTSKPRAERDVPEHPPWQRQLEPHDPQQPLLVPTFGRRPDERPVNIRGRWFLLGQWNRDERDADTSDYLLTRTGLRSDVTNALGFGERTRFAGEYRGRRVMLDDTRDETDQNGRVDLASIAIGTEGYAPLGLEVGRFLSPHLPEIGLLDGAEVVARYQGGVRIGAGAGAYPRPFPARNSGDDVGVHAFIDYVADDRRSFAAAFGVQKTWHRGAADRDLIVTRAEWRPTSSWSVLANAKVDFYSGSDTIKGQGVELTELLTQARWRAKTTGIGVMASHFAWPELKRFEYQFLSTELVRDGAVDRISVDGWWRAQPWLSLRLRADRFEDETRDGTSVNASADVREVFGPKSSIGISVFRSEGSFSSGPGARVFVQDRIGSARVRLAYRWHRYTLDALASGEETLTRQSASLSVSWPIGDRLDVDLNGERWFGDGEDSFAAGFYMQWRF